MHKKREKETVKRKEVNGRKQKRSGKYRICVEALVNLETPPIY